MASVMQADAIDQRDSRTSEAIPHRRLWKVRPWWLVTAAIALAVAVAAFSISGGPAWWDGARATLASPERFRAWTQEFGVWAPVVFVLAEAAQVIVAIIPGGIFPPVAGAAFGPAAGLAICMCGTTIGSAFVFVLARKWGRPLLELLVSSRTIDKYAGVITGRGGLWLFIMLAVPFLPGDAVCAMVGASKISFRRFLVVTTLGRLPSTAAGVYLATSLLAGSSAIWLPAMLLVLIALGLGCGYRDRIEGWLLRHSDYGADH